ncbi:type II secretion system F family protein [Hydrogenophaga sp.]|jgi:type II secretory pathway component PulF|uniref:type II secretion system F family protein n=1 Tax=Hydrogenophaga sp. TaxID=1904254 RepID=UPI002715E1BD|nr:type II secretion system F family protein [Hydrogenophaga sp.]MDO9134051.1 type II secretion system F family protein [Hydrogenophaga sp.]
MNDFEVKFSRFMFKRDSAQRRRLYQKLAKLLGNGVQIIDALQTMQERRVILKSAKDPVAVALAEWIRKLRNGARLSVAIDGWVGTDEQMLISAGEQSGNIDAALVSTAEIMEAKKKIRSAVIGGLAYPGFMMIIAFAVLIMFSYKIIPEFSQVVPYEKWRGLAKAMVDFANFTRTWMFAIAGAPVLLITAFMLSLPRWKDGMRITLDRYMPFSVYRMLHGSTWMISFASLVSAGVRLENALGQLMEGASPWMQVRIQACLRGMRSGLNPGDALARSGYGFPDAEIIDDLGVYAKLSGFDVALGIIGREWITESVERIQMMMKVIFGASVLMVGLFIALMVGGLIGMELQMTQIMQGTYR